MPQIPGLGLDQAQLSDLINQQYKGYSQKQRNQMSQSAAASPDNWTALTQKSNQQAQNPTEFLGAGRTSNIPTVSQDGQQLTGYDSSNLGSLFNQNTGYQGRDFDYTDSAGKGYFNLNTQKEVESSAPNYISGSFGTKMDPNFQDPNTKSAGGYYFADPWGFSHGLDKVGNNKYFVSGDTLNQHTRSGTADTFYGLDTSKDLSGLQYGMNGGKGGLFFDPSKTNLSNLLSPQRNNSAYAEKKSGGILGPLNQLMNKVDPINGWVENTVGKGLGFDSGLDMVRQIGEPIGNIAGMYFTGYPLGSLAMGAENASTGNWDAVGNNALNALTTYAGSNIPTDSVAGTGYSLGSSTANNAANSFLTNTATNYARTGDLGNALKSSAFSAASGLGGNWLSGNLNGSLGEIGSKALGGAASGALNSLFSGNSPVNGSLFGAMSGGLHGFLNSTDRSNNTYNEKKNTVNKQTAQQAAKLAKLFVKK